MDPADQRRLGVHQSRGRPLSQGILEGPGIRQGQGDRAVLENRSRRRGLQRPGILVLRPIHEGRGVQGFRLRLLIQPGRGIRRSPWVPVLPVVRLARPVLGLALRALPFFQEDRGIRPDPLDQADRRVLGSRRHPEFLVEPCLPSDPEDPGIRLLHVHPGGPACQEDPDIRAVHLGPALL